MTPFKIYYVGYQDREVIPEKIAKALGSVDIHRSAIIVAAMFQVAS